jgi:two-component system, LytTR family, sensor kinase
LKNVEDYVALENIRFNDKISLHISGQRALQVPKFSIQLIVENAIKHGLQNKKELNIFISIDKDASSVTIKNDGLPIKEKQFGIGLSNLEQRLKLLQNGSLHIADEQNPTYIILIGE